MTVDRLTRKRLALAGWRGRVIGEDKEQALMRLLSLRYGKSDERAILHAMEATFQVESPPVTCITDARFVLCGFLYALTVTGD